MDENADGRALFGRTLIRKFPSAAVVECADGSTAVSLAATERFGAIVVHRAGAYDGESLVREVRAVAHDALLIMLSGIDRSAAAAAAGATGFLDYDRWLMLGTVIKKMLTGHAPRQS